MMLHLTECSGKWFWDLIGFYTCRAPPPIHTCQNCEEISAVLMLVLCLTSLSLPEPAVARRERERDRQTGREGERGGNGWKAVLSLCVESSNLWSPLISLPQRLIVGRIAQDRKETSGDTSGGRGEKDRQQLLEEETETVFGRLRGHCEGRDGELKQSRWGKREQKSRHIYV